MGPAEAILLFGRRCAGQVSGPRAHVLFLARGRVEPCERTFVAAAVCDVWIVRIDRDIGALTQRDTVPLADRQPFARCARPFEGALILLRTIDVKWELVVERDVIELSRRLIELGAPRVP